MLIFQEIRPSKPHNYVICLLRWFSKTNSVTTEWFLNKRAAEIFSGIYHI